jgi:hypothetical protein
MLHAPPPHANVHNPSCCVIGRWKHHDVALSATWEKLSRFKCRCHTCLPVSVWNRLSTLLAGDNVHTHHISTCSTFSTVATSENAGSPQPAAPPPPTHRRGGGAGRGGGSVRGCEQNCAGCCIVISSCAPPRTLSSSGLPLHWSFGACSVRKLFGEYRHSLTDRAYLP